MNKFLLTATCALGLSLAANANVVTFDFTTNDYGLPNDGNTYVKNPTTISQDAIEITLDGKSADVNSWRMWTDGLRAYYNKDNPRDTKLTIAVNGGSIQSIVFTYVSGFKLDLAEGAPGTYDNGTWTGDAPSISFKYTATSNKALKTVAITYTGGQVSTISRPEIICVNNQIIIQHDKDTEAYYTTDNTEPTTNSTHYTAPFNITANTTIKAIAAKGDEVSRVTTFNAIYVGSYANYAELIAAGDGTQGTVNGPITGIYKNGFNLYTVDAAGGFMLLYDTNKFPGLGDVNNGDSFASVTGKFKLHNGLPEITDLTLGEKTAGTAVQPEVLTVEEVSMDMLNKYVKFENVSIVAGDKSNNYNMTDATGTLLIYNQFSNANNYDVLTVPEGEGFTVTGFVSCYNTTLQLTPVLFEGGKVMETVATPTFSVAAGPVAAGTTVEITTATPDATIFYTLDNTDPGASSTLYDGAITIDKAMTIKAIALKEGMLDSQVAAAAYTILDPTASVASFNFTDPSTLTPTVATPSADATETDISNLTLTNNAVSLTFSGKESGSAVPRLWFNKNNGIDLRLYSSQSFTVKVSEGFVLDNIEFAHYANDKLAGLNSGKIGTYAVNADDSKKATWTAPGEAEGYVAAVTFNVTATSQVTTLNVTYKKGEAQGVDNIAVDDNNTPAVYYNLQGVRVDNPTPGLYIVRRGNTATKTLVR